MNTRNW